MNKIFPYFVKLILFDVLIKCTILLTQGNSIAINSELGSTLGYFFFIEVIFFGLPYFLVLLIYIFILKNFLQAFKQLGEILRCIFSVLFTLSIASLVYFIQFYNEWPNFQTIAFFINSALVGLALYWITRERFSK